MCDCGISWPNLHAFWFCFCCFIVYCCSNCLCCICVESLFWKAVHIDLFLVFNDLAEEERAGCVILIVSLLLYGCKCYRSFPHDAVGWSVVYDCVISWSNSLTYEAYVGGTKHPIQASIPYKLVNN